MSTRSLIIALSLLVFLVGCDSEPTEEATDQANVGSYVPIASFESIDSDSIRKEAVQKVGTFNAAISQTLRENKSWKKVDEEVRRLLEERGSRPYTASLQEVAANRMLTRLLEAEPSSERDEAMGRYASMLVEAGHTDVALLSKVFPALEGHWSEARLRSAIDTVLATAKTKCADCESTPSLPSTEDEEQVEAAVAKTKARSDAAMEELRDFRDRIGER